MDDTQVASLDTIAYDALKIIGGEGAQFQQYPGNMYDEVGRLGLPHISRHLAEATMDSEYSSIFTVNKPIEPKSGLVITVFGGSVTDLIYAYRRDRAILITSEACSRLAVEVYDLSQKPAAEHRLYTPFVEGKRLVVSDSDTTAPCESVEQLAEALHALLQVE